MAEENENNNKKKKFSLSSLFFEDDEPKKDEGEKEQEEDNSPPVTISGTTVQSTPVAPATGGFDKRVFESLIKSLEQNNQEGFDYFEFKNSLEALRDVIVDEATRFKSAYATATTMGIDINKLIESAEFYLSVLKEEEKKFQVTLMDTKNSKVLSKEKEIKDIDTYIKKKSEEITKLTNDINTLQQDKIKITNSISESKVKIESTGISFNATYGQLVERIKYDISKMKSYLK